MEGKNTKKILIIDDDEDILKLLTLRLEQQDYKTIEATDGVIGLEKLWTESPDVVIADVNMPGMTGFEFCEKASRYSAENYIPIIIMTAQDDQESVNKAYENGATDFITKPINQAKLNHRLQFSLRGSEVAKTLASREKQLLSAQKVAKMGEWIYDLRMNEFYFSSEVLNIFGIDKQHKLSFDELLKYVEKSDDLKKVKDVSSTFGSRDIDIEYTIKTGFDELKRIRLVVDTSINETENQDKVFGIFQDITDLRNAEKEVKKLSFYDSVTNLPNRQFFKRLLDKTITASEQHDRRFALLNINLDNFMRVNTTFGRDVGDKLLLAVSERLNKVIRDSDSINNRRYRSLFGSGLLAHFGGDDFIVLLNDIKTADDAAKVASRINILFDDPIEVFDKEVRTTTSIGIGVFPEDGDDVEGLLKKVSIALHNAKETGRNCYRFYTDSMNTLSFQRLSMETGLRKALEREEFQLYYQPKVSLIDGRITGAEALIRWKHPDMGLVPPVDFIPVAESTGLIVAITDWAIAEALRQLSSWREDGYELESVSINITPASLSDRNINDHVMKHLLLAGVEVSKLDLEITESVLMEDFDTILPILNEFKELGASISIDDFGTGYSSLSYLKRLPVSKLKIDQSFIHDLMHNNDDPIIVNALISLAHNLGFRVIAEGVEKIEQLEYLKEHGCDVVQGYYYSRPVPAEEFREWAMAYEKSIK